MFQLILNLVFVLLLAVGLYVLYYQNKVYQEQKKLIARESKAVKILRHDNLGPLRSRFFLRRVKLKA